MQMVFMQGRVSLVISREMNWLFSRFVNLTCCQLMTCLANLVQTCFKLRLFTLLILEILYDLIHFLSAFLTLFYYFYV